MKTFEIEVERVNGYCSCSYKQGDTFRVHGYNTPANFCGGAYTMLFPIIVALNSGATFGFEENPRSKTKMACPDNGNIIFKVTVVDE